MNELPKDVRRAKAAISRGMYSEWAGIADKLICDAPDLVAMWRELERLKCIDDPPPIWVWHFLRASFDASNLPPYHYKSKAERRDLVKNITTSADCLVRTIKANGLDVSLIHNDGKLFNGFFFYEDFGESNRASIDADKVNKLRVSELIESFATRAKAEIEEEPMPGKKGANVMAIRFVRMIGKNNQRMYGKPLNTVTATATNAIFATSYTPSDISNLLKR